MLVNGIYTGSFGHTDDLKSVAPSLAYICKQAEIVKSFTEKNCLKLNTRKLKLLPMSNGIDSQVCEIQIGSASIISSSQYVCLRLWKLAPRWSPTCPPWELSSRDALGKKLLNLPNHHTDLCPLVALRWPSVHLCILQRNYIHFLRRQRIPRTALRISAKVFFSLKEQGL